MNCSVIASCWICLVVISCQEKGLTNEAATVRADLKFMQGTWKVDHIEIGGVVCELANGMVNTFSIHKDRVTIRYFSNGKEERGMTESMRFKLADIGKAKSIDFYFDNGAQMAGIYRTRQKTLEIAWNVGGSERPTRFQGDQINGTIVFVRLVRDGHDGIKKSK